MRRQRVTLTIHGDTMAQIKALAKEQNRTLSNMIETIFRSYLDHI